MAREDLAAPLELVMIVREVRALGPDLLRHVAGEQIRQRGAGPLVCLQAALTSAVADTAAGRVDALLSNPEMLRLALARVESGWPLRAVDVGADAGSVLRSVGRGIATTT